MTTTWFSAPAPVARRVRAYFAPVNRAAQTPVLFDPSEQGAFNLDAPPLALDQSRLDRQLFAQGNQQNGAGNVRHSGRDT
jgi:hypothetical protein